MTYRIPTLHRGKSIGSTPWVRAICNVIQHPRVCVERGIEKPQRSLADGETCFDDAIDNGAEDWRRGRSPSREAKLSTDVHRDVVTVCADILVSFSKHAPTHEQFRRRMTYRDTTANPVVQAGCLKCVDVARVIEQDRVGWVCRIVFCKVLCNSCFLIIRRSIYIGEASATSKR